MANSPPTINVVKIEGSGNVQVYPMLPTQLLGTQDGSDVGTGGPSLADIQGSSENGNFSMNRVIEFGEDRFILAITTSATDSGVYKKAQGGAGQWGRVQGGFHTPKATGACSSLHIVHPGGVPTLTYISIDVGNNMYVFTTTDIINGTAGTFWGTNVGDGLEGNTQSPVDYGQSIVFRNSIFWAHRQFNGASGTGAITQYDFVLSALTRYNVSSIMHNLNFGSSYAFHVHDNVLFVSSWATGSGAYARVMKLQAGSFVTVITDTAQTAGSGDNVLAFPGHGALFTDPGTGDLIFIESGVNDVADVPRARTIQIQNATGAASLIDISSTVMGSTEGADKYLQGGGSATGIRRWSVNVDTDTVPASPRVYLTTWQPSSGATETWEWKGVAAEMEAVGSLNGITGRDFAFPYNTVGGGSRSPRITAIEMEGPHIEEAGGTKIFFRSHGSASVGVVTFRGTDKEGSPITVLPIITFTIESGSPATTPTISGSTLINLTPDNGATLYSVRLTVATAGADIDEGDVGLIIPEFV